MDHWWCFYNQSGPVEGGILFITSEQTFIDLLIDYITSSLIHEIEL